MSLGAVPDSGTLAGLAAEGRHFFLCREPGPYVSLDRDEVAGLLENSSVEARRSFGYFLLVLGLCHTVLVRTSASSGSDVDENSHVSRRGREEGEGEDVFCLKKQTSCWAALRRCLCHGRETDTTIYKGKGVSYLRARRSATTKAKQRQDEGKTLYGEVEEGVVWTRKSSRKEKIDEGAEEHEGGERAEEDRKEGQNKNAPVRSTLFQPTKKWKDKASGLYFRKYDDGEGRRYDAASPDELALVSTARYLGLEFSSRPGLLEVELNLTSTMISEVFLSPSEAKSVRGCFVPRKPKRRLPERGMTLDAAPPSAAVDTPDDSEKERAKKSNGGGDGEGETLTTASSPSEAGDNAVPVITYELLDVLEFDFVRKRMSVITRCPYTGQILLLTKGADTSMMQVLNDTIKQKTGSTRFLVSLFAVRSSVRCPRVLSKTTQ